MLGGAVRVGCGGKGSATYGWLPEHEWVLEDVGERQGGAENNRVLGRWSARGGKRRPSWLGRGSDCLGWEWHLPTMLEGASRFAVLNPAASVLQRYEIKLFMIKVCLLGHTVRQTSLTLWVMRLVVIDLQCFPSLDDKGDKELLANKENPRNWRARIYIYALPPSRSWYGPRNGLVLSANTSKPVSHKFKFRVYGYGSWTHGETVPI